MLKNWIVDWSTACNFTNIYFFEYDRAEMEENLPFRTLWIARVESLSQLNQPSWEFKQQQQAESPTAAVSHSGRREEKKVHNKE